MSTHKRIAKRVISAILTIMMLMSMVTIGITSASAAYTEIAETGVNMKGGEVFYLKPSSNWTQANARFAIYFFNDSTGKNTWVDMKLVEGVTSVYTATAPSGDWANLIFCRMNPGTTANNWNNKWTQSANLTYDGTKNLYTVSGWDAGSWSTYTPPAPVKPGDDSGWNLIGTFNDDYFTVLHSLIYTEDTSVASYTMDLDAGTYTFKVADDAKGTWNGFGAVAATLSGGGTISSDGTNDDNCKLVADGGTYTFNYTVATKKLNIVYTAPEVTAPESISGTVTPSAVVAGTEGDGTEANPYCVAPEAATNLLVSATAEGADGFAYAIGDATDKTIVAEGTWSDLLSATSPALEDTSSVKVTLWAYNKVYSTYAYSEPTEVTIWLKGYEAEEVPDEPVFTIDWATENGLYAYAGAVAEGETPNTDAWQRWTEDNGGRYFFLPVSANNDSVILYNTYSTDVLVNGVVIPAGKYATVPYVAGTTYTCGGATTQTVTIYKSDAEGTLFINGKAGMITVNDDKDKTKTTIDNAAYDVYGFLIGDSKNREVTGLGGAVADENGVRDAAVKKIKGRGNSTWNLAKKPFNITFSSTQTIDGMTAGKKWSLLANAQDPSLIRNRLVYDMANEVGMKYACESRFVDFFVDGKYLGSYQLTQKIEMDNKGTSVIGDLEETEFEVTTDPETNEVVSATPESNFNFMLELDTEKNAKSANDNGTKTNRGQWMTFKIPDEYPTQAQQDWVMAKYQAVEDALYGDNLTDLAELVDIKDFARAYLVNELAKNLDSGVTSCYFVYDSANDIFRMSPVWDYDNALGNSVSVVGERNDADGKSLDLAKPDGWYAKELMHYDENFTGGRSVFSQACYMTSVITDEETGETTSFNDIVKEVFNEDFLPLIDILEGADSDTARFKSVDTYLSNLTASGNWNYSYGAVNDLNKETGWAFTADNGWVSTHNSLVMYDYDAEANYLNTEVIRYDQNTLEGQANYAADWMLSRINWMAAQYAEEAAEVEPIGTMTIYFSNNWLLKGLNAYYWGSSVSNPQWPGIEMTFAYTNDQKEAVYSIEVPADIQGIIFNGEHNDAAGQQRQTVDIKEGLYNNAGFYCTSTNNYDDGTEKNINVGTWTNVPKMDIYLNATAWGYEGATFTVQYVVGDEVTPAADGEATNSVAMTAVEGDAGVFTAQIPENSTGVAFTKVVGEEAVSTEGLTIEGNNNYYTITEVDAETGTVTNGTWGVYTAPVIEPITVYAINSAKWDALYAHAWIEGGAGTAWPGTEMTKTDETVNGFDVYTITFDVDYLNIIFNNNNNGKQTKDLELKADQYYDIKTDVWYASLDDVPEVDPLSTDRYILGEFNEWNALSHEFKLNAEGEKVGYVTIALEADTTYKFKVIREGDWTSCATPITGSVEGLQFSSSVNADATITTTVAGDYVFAFGLDDSMLTVTYPETETIYFSNGDVEIAEGTVVTANGSEMTLSDGIYSAVVAKDTDITFSWSVIVDEAPAVINVLAGDNGENDLYTLTGLNEAGDGYDGTWSVYEAPVETKTIYLDIADVWVVADGVSIAVDDTVMNLSYGTVYKADIPVDAQTITFKHITTALDGNEIIQIETTIEEGKDLYTLSNVTDEETGDVTLTGTWSVYTEPEIPDMPTLVTVYFINSKQWDIVNVYAWGNTEAVAYPGVEMEKTGDKTDGYDIYSLSFDSKYTNILFNNKSDATAEGEKTTDLTVMDGQYYDALSGKWLTEPYIYLVLNPGTEAEEQIKFEAGEGLDSVITLDLEAGEYAFQINRQGTVVNAKDAEGKSPVSITDTVSGINFSSKVTDVATIVVTEENAGKFTFKYHDSKLAVIYPDGEDVPVVPDPDMNYYIRSNFTGEWTDILLEGEGTVLTATVELTNGTYKFKITQNNVWYGNNGTIEDVTEGDGWTFREKDDAGNTVGDATLKATGGTYTFTFDTVTNKLKVEAEIVLPEYAVTYNEGEFTVNGNETAIHGQNYEFTVDANEGYVVSAVIYNMEALEAVDGLYTIENVQGDINFIVVTSEKSQGGNVSPYDTFMVTFLNKDGSILAVRKVLKDTEVEIIDGPAVEDYIFEGWSPAPVISREENGVQYITVDKDYVFTPIYKEYNNDTEIIPGTTAPTIPDVPVEPVVKTYTVIFVDDNNKFIEFQTVEEGKDATLPEAPAKTGYTFKEWSGEYTNVTENRTIVAVYEKKAAPSVEAPTHGTLKIDIAGGTSFTLNDRPQGTSYHNSYIKIGETITVVANSSNGNEFIGWVYASNGQFASKTPEFTFVASGDDNYKALYKTNVDGVQSVGFVNDKSGGGNGRILDMQYYASTETIVFPEDTFATGFIFKGWKLEGDTTNTEVTEAMIQAEIAKGNDVTIVPIWQKEIVYVNITVVNGTGGGKVEAKFATTVTANAAPAGQKFAYWVDGNGNVKSYNEAFTFYPREDMELTAVFVPEDEVIEKQILIGMDTVEINTSNNGLSFIASWYVPEDYDFVAAGLIAVDKTKYVESNFYAGANQTSTGVYTKTSTKSETTYTWNKKDIAYGDTWVTQLFVQYRDANGELVTEYFDKAEYTKTEDGVIEVILN